MTLLAALLASLSSLPAAACGPDSDCRIGDRHYRIRMPAGHDGKTPIGAIVFSHGYTGNARGAMRSKGFAAMARKMNVAIISTKSAGRDWTLPGSPKTSRVAGVDELAYFDRVIEDAAKRFPIDRKRLVATGFSAGGMMVWNLACHRSQLFAGFIPIAGTFWAPIPRKCTTPVASIVHVHGDNDKTVPLKGRPIRETRQGDVAEALDMYTRYGKFGPPTVATPRGLHCRVRKNPAGHILNFCLYVGGHSFYIRHIRQAWEMLAKAGRL
ncbi:MAG: alpha/beta hydrolase family esterase [Hyphomicrobiaceae bacterium]